MSDPHADYLDITNLPRDGEWVETRGQNLDYNKEQYDVRTCDGLVRLCWPNAGRFHDLDRPGVVIDFSDVTHVRLADERMMERRRPARRLDDPHPDGNRAMRRARR